MLSYQNGRRFNQRGGNHCIVVNSWLPWGLRQQSYRRRRPTSSKQMRRQPNQCIPPNTRLSKTRPVIRLHRRRLHAALPRHAEHEGHQHGRLYECGLSDDGRLRRLARRWQPSIHPTFPLLPRSSRRCARTVRRNARNSRMWLNARRAATPARPAPRNAARFLLNVFQPVGRGRSFDVRAGRLDMAKDTTGRLRVTVKTGGKRKLSSKLWLERQLNDPYVARRSAKVGVRARPTS